MSKKKVVETVDEQMNTGNYYTAVIDVQDAFGNINGMNETDSYRYFIDKFVPTPEMALLAAVDIDNERWKAWDAEDLFKDVTFDPERNEYVLTRFYTTKWNTPTPEQFKKFMSGEYKFNRQTFYIQILKTDLVTSDFSKKSATYWNNKMGMLRSAKEKAS